MSYRFFAASVLALCGAASLVAQAPRSSPKTPDGHPDLGGVWTNATVTPLERPKAFASKSTLTDAEAVEFEKQQATDLQDVDGKSEHPLLAAAGSNGTGGYNVLFIDRGTQMARVDGVKRTSLIFDPPDGKVPPLTADGRKRMASEMRSYMSFGNVKERPLAERCLLGFGSTSGPPMLPVLYNNNYQIVQTADTVMIMVEMVHDVRVIRMNQKHVPPDVRKWLGDSVGHWEGDTLVVDTTNFNPHINFYGSSDNLHVIERFRRVDADTILYRATIDDPTTFTKQWSIEFPFTATPGPVYEYACHEGNYAMQDILGGARKMESERK